MKERLSKLLRKVSGKPPAHPPRLPPSAASRVAPRLDASRARSTLEAPSAPKLVAKGVLPKLVASHASRGPVKRGAPKLIVNEAVGATIASGGSPPTQGRTGWTVHRDVALRLKNLSVHEPVDSPDDPGRELGAFKIRLAGSVQVRWDAGSLVQQRYSVKGYQTSATPVSNNICTFAAYDEGRLAGTVSLRHDSTEGLAADEIYRQELNVLRDAGRHLCEFTRLAVDASRVSKPVLAGLFHTVYLYATKLHNFDYVVIEVNPRHVAYYRHSLGFKAIGPERHNSRVQAPAVLMGMSFGEIAEHLHRHAGSAQHVRKTRTLYEYGFSPSEEAGILARLQTLGAN